MDDLYVRAARAGIAEMDGALPGEDPMSRAWRGTLSVVLDRAVERNPSREGAVRLVRVAIDPGPVPMRIGSGSASRVASVVLGGIAGRLVLFSLIVSLGFSGETGVFLSTLAGAAAGGWLVRGRSSWDRDEAFTRLAVLAGAADQLIEASLSEDRDDPGFSDSGIGRALHDLHGASAENLVAAAEALLIEAANGGYEGLNGKPLFAGGASGRSKLTWSRELGERYDCFGSYDYGDAVIEERPPVIRDGEILAKGVVRRATR